MSLAAYSESYWHPDGSPAAGDLAYVFPRHSTSLQPLFTDATGTVPVPNPVNIPANGTLSFFAETGDYWIFVKGQSYPVIIDVDPNLTHTWSVTTRFEQATPALVWTVTHELDFQPGVTVVSSTGQISEGDVQYVSPDVLTITFGAPVAGVAYLRR
jgi:hypothetical protein